MNDLRTAALQALEALGSSQYAQPRQMAAITALRAALAQQKDPTDPGNDVDVLREHVRHLERRVRELHAQQDEPLNLADPAVRKRLATQWGYAPSAQVEPVGEILPNWSTEQERIVGTWAYLNDLGTNLPVGTKLYAAPPQRKQAEPVEATLGYARKIERLTAQRDDLLQALKKIRGFTVDGAVVYAAMVDINAVASRAIKAAEAKE